MSDSRLNPLLNLTQAAEDIAKYLKDVKAENFEPVYSSVKTNYEAPLNSWLLFIPYYIGGWRKRSAVLGETETIIKNLEKDAEKNTDSTLEEKPISILESIAKVLKDKTGGWKETSFNTNLVRAVLKELPQYDSNVELTLKEIETMKKPLLDALENQLLEKVDEKNKSIITINAEQEELNDALKFNKLKVFRKKGDIFLSSCGSSKTVNLQNETELQILKKQLQILEQEKEIREKDLLTRIEKLEAEKAKCIEERETAKKTLILLNPELDIKKWETIETEVLITEIKKNNEAVVMVNSLEKNKILQRKEELTKLPKINEKSVKLEKLLGNKKINEESEKRREEAKEKCASRQINNSSIIFRLNKIFAAQLAVNKIPEKIENQKANIKTDFQARIDDLESKFLLINNSIFKPLAEIPENQALQEGKKIDDIPAITMNSNH